jgi:hypothetical protein
MATSSVGMQFMVHMFEHFEVQGGALLPAAQWGCYFWDIHE